jgi:hypothetical protein
MAAAAHTPGGYGGVPQSVGKDFNEADSEPMKKGKKAIVSALRSSPKSFSANGSSGGSSAGG